jgi:hypothetical protein
MSEVVRQLLLCCVRLIQNNKFSTFDPFQAKKEIYTVKEQRLMLAQDEYQHLNETLGGWKSSRTSRKYHLSKTDLTPRTFHYLIWGAGYLSGHPSRLFEYQFIPSRHLCDQKCNAHAHTQNQEIFTQKLKLVILICTVTT